MRKTIWFKHDFTRRIYLVHLIHHFIPRPTTNKTKQRKKNRKSEIVRRESTIFVENIMDLSIR